MNRSLFAALFMLVAFPSTSFAARVTCTWHGKKYTHTASRCTNGKRFRCVGQDKWKYFAKCKTKAQRSQDKAHRAAQTCVWKGKKYTKTASRCTDGKRYRCVGPNKWKYFAKCKTKAQRAKAKAKRASRYCMWKGKKYTYTASRCTNGKRYRCVGPNKWKYLMKCKK